MSKYQSPKTLAARRRGTEGRPGLRVRVGNDSILYSVEHGVLLVVIVTVGHRRDVYHV